MENPSLLNLLKKRWYIVAIIGLLIAALVYHIRQSGIDFGSPDALKLIVRNYGYYGILLLTFLEGETIVIIAGFMSASIGLDPKLIALSAFCGSFISDQIMFSLGKYKGESVLRYFPRIARNVGRATTLFKKYDTALILGFRFVYGVRNVTPIMLGISGVSHLKFLILNFIGASVWALCFTYGGVYIGDVFSEYMHNMGHGIFYVLALLAVIGGGIWYLRSHRSTKKVLEISGLSKAELKKKIASQAAPPDEAQPLPRPNTHTGDDDGRTP
jgi:Uncharacterized membrane-associated protein